VSGRRRATRALLAHLALLAVLTAAAAVGQSLPALGQPSTAEPPPLPDPDLAGLEPAVAAQLAEARATAAALLETPEAAPVVRSAALGDLGRIYHAYGLVEAAAACYRHAAALAPGELRWPYLLGQAERARGDLAAARQAFEASLRLGDYPPAHVALSELALVAGDNAEAEASARRAVALTPGDAGALAALGQALLALGRHAEAVQSLSAALAALPAADRLHYPLALAYRGLGDEPRAREHLARAGRTGARSTDPLLEELESVRRGELVPLLRGRRAAGAGDWASAEREFGQAVAANPDSVPARINLAAALIARGAVAEGRDELETALRLQPDNPTARFNLGVLLLRAGDLAGAAVHLAVTVAAAPGDAEARRTLGETLLALGRARDALPHLSAAVAASPADEAARFAEAEALLRLGEERAALARLEEAHRLLPEEGRLAHLLARVLAGADDLALRDGARAVDLAARVWTAQPIATHGHTLALALAESGRCAEAATLARRLAAEHPGAAAAELTALAERVAAGPPCRPASPAERREPWRRPE
jgi:tetratricopeptide (TPR) repeat protein